MTEIPVPYNMTNDDIIMLLFILNIIGMSYVILMNGASIIERTKGLFYYQGNATPFNDRTHITRICNTLLYTQTILYMTIIAMNGLLRRGDVTLTENTLQYTGAFATFFVLILLLKKAMYKFVNNVLYTKKEALEWDNLYFFTIKLTGFLLAPAVIAILFIPEIAIKYVNIYLLLTATTYIYAVISGLFKIIFAKKRNYLEIFLYLCALEFLPMAMVWKTVQQLSEFITIKF